MAQHAYLCDDATYYVYQDRTCTHCNGSGTQNCFDGVAFENSECAPDPLAKFTTRRDRNPADHCPCVLANGVMMDSAQPLAANATMNPVNVPVQVCTPKVIEP